MIHDARCKILNAKEKKAVVRRTVRTKKKKEEKKKEVKKVTFDWPCWRGSDHNGISKEKNWKSQWSAGAEPKILWTKELGGGYSPLKGV